MQADENRLHRIGIADNEREMFGATICRAKGNHFGIGRQRQR
jgi:hypothetical protein